MSDQSKCEQGKQELWSATRSVLSSYRKGLRMQKVPRDGALPLSFAQQRVWFLEQLDPLNTGNNIPIGFRLIGSLNQAVLEQSIAEIVRRHEVLRTNVETVDGQAVQIISPDLTLTLPVIDLRELSHTEREAEVQRQATEEAQQAFDLTERSFFRVKLLRLDEEEHVLFLNMHHIISDGWSLMVFFQELTTLYEAFSNSQPSPLVELPIQYADFAVWQRKWLQGEVLESQLSYWKQQLGGNLPLSQLPTERPRPPIQTYRGAMQFLELPENLALLLKSLSQREGVTLFMTLLAAFQTLLYRYTGQEDILVGSPIAGRNRVETKRLIGLFINTLVMRTYLGGNPTFLELLGRVKEVAIGAYAHQDLPFEKLVEQLLPERSLSHTPLFQVMFVFQNALIQSFKFPGLTLTPLEIHSGTARFDLTLEIQETSDSLKGWFEYNTDLFEAATIARMAGHFQTLLLGIVAHPEQRLSELPILTEAERHQLLVEWNDTHTEYPQDKCIHELFEAQVELTPDAVAVLFEDQQLSYQELNRRANQLAHYLQARGVEPEVLVGICVDRSIEMVVGLLGILKAGGAYVPLDPRYPQERLAFMLNDSQMSMLLTTEKLVALLPEHEAQVVCLDTNWGLTLTESAENPVSGLQPSNLAYVIYTSGSTGKPKGVMVPHHSLVNFTLSAQVEYQMSKSDRILQFASISFDVAAEEIFLCLSCGGILVLRSDDMLNSVPEFVHKCSLLEVTILDLPTAYWNQIISELANHTNFMLPPSLRLVIIGGEQALPEKVKMWYTCVGEYPLLLNVYGPTEATVATTVCKLSDLGSAKLVLQQVPIGRPIHNVQVYVLDQYLQPVPIGVPGELYIGGAGVARGYLHRPDLTQGQFIPNPFLRSDELEDYCSILNSKSKIENYSLARLYKTGDLVCYRTDGQVEFLGRIDDQVKIRGFRIEPGEIEAVLAQHLGVRATVVMVQEDVPRDKRLVAYIVPQPALSATTEDLRHFLKQKLPNYMIPSAFVLLDTLPLTPNGKVDRRALKAPSQPNSEENLIVAPRTLTEEMLARIWAEILNIESFTRGRSDINIYDNFFDLGGHSLVATLLITRIRQVFQVDLPLWRLFNAPTIAGLASSIDIERQTNMLKQQIKPKPWSTLVPIQLGGSKRPFFLVPGGENGGEFELINYAKLVYFLGQEQPVYGLKARGCDPKQQPHTQVEVMASDYIKDIRALQPSGPYLLGGECVGGVVAFEIARQLVAVGQKVGLLVLIDTQCPSHAQQIDYFLKRVTFKLQTLKRIPYHLTKLLQLNFRELQPYTFDKVQKAKDLFVEQKYATVLMRYRPRPYIGRITLLVNEDYYQENPSMGWDHVAAGGLEIHKIPGNHESYLGEYVKSTAEKLKACLDAAQAETLTNERHMLQAGEP